MMSKRTNSSFFSVIFLSFFISVLTQNAQNSVEIGGNTPNPSAVLPLVGNRTSELIISMTSDHNTVTKMVVYNNNTDKIIYSCDGTIWKSLGGTQSTFAAGAGISITGSTIANTGDNG